jgi:hypothetical protein
LNFFYFFSEFFNLIYNIMKNIQDYNNFILENVQSYDWEFKSDRGKIIEYTFIDNDGNDYLVQFKNIPGLKPGNLSTEFELVYFVHDGDNYSVSKLVGSNVWRTVRTVLTDILNDFIERNLWVKKIVINGLSKDQEKSYVSKRTRLYDRHLERNPIPGFKKQVLGNRINLIRT